MSSDDSPRFMKSTGRSVPLSVVEIFRAGRCGSAECEVKRLVVLCAGVQIKKLPCLCAGQLEYS